MITVKMLLPLLKNAKGIMLDWNGLCRKFDPDDAIDVDAYGNYAVDRITSIGSLEKQEYELRIAFQPIKATEV